MIVKTDNIRKTIVFLYEQFSNSEYFKENESYKHYRLSHTFRVAHIGSKIALGDNLNEEALIIGCLLHDISYALGIKNDEDWLNHGRNAAKMARQFLETLTLDKEVIDEILYGIAIHVDDKADFSGERTPLALSISDCDNIDRFDAYRLYESLKYSNLDNMTQEEQLKFTNKMLDKLNKLYSYEIATKTGKILWQDTISFQITFYERLLKQLECSQVNL